MRVRWELAPQSSNYFRPWSPEELFPPREPAVALQSRDESAAGPPGSAEPAPRSVVGLLVATEGELAGEVYRLFAGDNRIGRAPYTDVTIPSASLSREEVRVTEEGGRFEIVALGRRSPVLVNGSPTRAAPLHDGDLVELGDNRFRFRTVAADGGPAVTRPRMP